MAVCVAMGVRLRKIDRNSFGAPRVLFIEAVRPGGELGCDEGVQNRQHKDDRYDQIDRIFLDAPHQLFAKPIEALNIRVFVLVEIPWNRRVMAMGMVVMRSVAVIVALMRGVGVRLLSGRRRRIISAGL
jgi:hypothetical protein